jgi:hypothetical protein
VGARSIRLEDTAHNGVIWLAVVRATSGRQDALAIGQVAASAVRMCGQPADAALRLLAQELGVLLNDQDSASVTTTATTGARIGRWSAAAGSGAASKCG